MGQQQLLLLVIGVILVGVAVMAGLTAVQKYNRQDEADGLLERSLTIATHAFHWKTVNNPFSGGNQSYQELAPNGMQRLALETETARGRFDITTAWPDSIEITAVSMRFPEVGVRVIVDQNNIRRTTIAYNGTITFD